ncbi:hypothetical protein BDZ97DRAFT_2058708 [Flammula alnicola]|nr:hypothetical protein BDZ97DRAFT_2058708 [Flammula alnicola]
MAWTSKLQLRNPNQYSGPISLLYLKKSLGHLLKPGQLDYHQIDSQIGSGYVQVNDLELNSETINGYLDGLPIMLQDGRISSVKVRIPWPNPLASTLGFSLKSLHLVFHVVPSFDGVRSTDIDLSESVASVAESFIHEELSPREEATLWQSFHQEAALHPDNSESHFLPGGLDMPGTSDYDPHKFDTDPAGVSVFASLIERLLARFEFDAQDIKISLIHPGNMNLTLSLQGIQYYTDTKSNPSPSSSMSAPVQGENRTLSITGLSLTSRNLSLPISPSFFPITTESPNHSPSTATSRPLSRASSNSSMDEETQFVMSQSLASLPPRSSSPNGSVSSSMYESAISTVSSAPRMQDRIEETPVGMPPSPSIPDPEVLGFNEPSGSSDEELLSFGSQPISLNLMTPSPVPQESDDDPFLVSTDSSAASKDELQVTMSIGIIACAIRPWQMQSLLRLTRAMATEQYTLNDAPPSKLSSTAKLPSIKAKAQIRATVLLLLSSASDEGNDSKTIHVQEFFDRPLVPPQLERSYTRIYVDSMSASGAILDGSTAEGFKPKGSVSSTQSSLTSFEINVADISVFFFNKSPEKQNNPLLISQYPRPLIHPHGTETYPTLPTFDVIDWTKENCRKFGTRLSHWRSWGPLSFFEDLILVSENQSSYQISASSQTTINEYSSAAWDMKGTRTAKERDDPGLNEFQPGLSEFRPSNQSQSRQKQRHPHEGRTRHSRLVINFPIIRLSIRCPPPSHLSNRSGTLVLDLHDINIALGSTPSKPSTRFAREDPSPPRLPDVSDESVLLKAEFSGAVFSCSMVGAATATAFASFGPLTEMDGHNEFMTSGLRTSPLQPRICVIKPSSGKSKCGVPALHVDISKSKFDALQYWADDVSQLLERLSGNEKEAEVGDSRDASLIGSRFFAKSRSGSGSALTFVRVMVPRTDNNKAESRPFDIKASDLDILVEFNPNRKQQTILTIGVMDLTIENTSSQAASQRFLGLTSPHSLSTSPKSIVKLSLSTTMIPETNTKETRIKLTMCGFTYSFFPDTHWISDLATFAKNPPGTFESVIPSDRTRIFVKIVDGSIRIFAPRYPGALVSHMQELEFSTDVIGDSRDSSFHIVATALALLAIDDAQDQESHLEPARSIRGISTWMAAGYALLAEVSDLDTTIVNQLNALPLWKVLVDRIVLRLHLCADTLTAVTAFSQDLGTLFETLDEKPRPSNKGPAVIGQPRSEGTTLMSSVEDLAFKKVPEVGPAPDMIYDDLPSNLDYLDESFGAAAGLRELVDEDLNDFDGGEFDTQSAADDPHVVSRIGGETIKIFDPAGLDAIDGYYLSIPPDKSHGPSYSSDATLSVRVLDGHLNLFLYDGYDWARTRKTIEEEVKEMRKRLAKIRQLVANGQIQDPTIEDTSALLFNSVHIGLEQDEDALAEPSVLIAAIDEELKDDLETASQSSWQSLRPPSSNKPRVRSTRVHGKRLNRSRVPSMEFCLASLHAEFDQFQPDDPLVSRTFVTVRDLEILDHIKTSTWKKFLTELRSDSRGNVRETDSNMVRIELRGVRPVPGNPSEEVRLRAKILPLRLYVDQDAVDFLKKFFSFKDPNSSPNADTPSDEGGAYIQLGEIFPIDLKLDYKPRRVDYRALKEGRTIELMNFFHFDGAEMTLRHITLAGVTGWPRFFEMLNDLWTPDVKATQLAEVISGVAPIRSVVNVGSGVADLILLPIAQYKKDGRIVRGVQKGATAFVKSTAIEAVKMGAKLATGTQVILEQAEGILGGQMETSITAEPVQVSHGDDIGFDNEDDEETGDLISKYAQQPVDLKEGVQSAYKSLHRNLSSAAQTILAVPMEVYERSGNEGPVRSIIRAVPIAVLKPMIGASEAVSKTLLGLHNTLDPNVRHDNEAKYKLR